MRSIKRAAIAFLVPTLAVLAPAAANAATVYVDDSASGSVHDGKSWKTAFTTIQAGVSGAAAGDEILIAAGAYPEHVAIAKANLRLKGAGESLTVLTYAGTASAGVTVTASGSVTFEQMGFSGLLSHGIEVLSDLDLTVRNCAFTDNAQGLMAGHAHGIVEDNTFQDNDSGLWLMETYSSVMNISNNHFVDNGLGVGEWPRPQGAYAFIHDNHFVGSSDQAILMQAEQGTSYIYDNHMQSGAVGISVLGGTHRIYDNVIEGNSSHGIMTTSAAAVIVHNTVLGNGGAGLYCYTSTSPDTSLVANNAFRANHQGFLGAAGCQARLQTNAAYANTGGDILGSYTSLGGNLAGVPFAFKPDYQPSSASSPLNNAGTPLGSAYLKLDYWGRPRTNPPEIGAVEYQGN